MTKKSVLLFLCCVANISLITAKEKPNFTLLGKINGQRTEKIVLSYVKGNKYIQDTAIIKNGNFRITGTIYEPTFASLSIDNVKFWLEPGQMNVQIDRNNSRILKLTGSKTQLEFNSYNQKIVTIDNNALKIWEKKNAVRDSLENPINNRHKTALEKRYDYWESLRKHEMKKRDSIKIQFIKSNPASFVSANLLEFFDKNELIPLDSLVCLFNNLDPKVQNGLDGKEIKMDITKKQNNQVGKIAPDFEAKDDIHNSVVKLSDFKGKVVLMDFWAHWCGPCRAGFKYLKPLYNRLNDKGFEIIAINTDRRIDVIAWKNAIAKDSVSMWHHVQVAENFSRNIITEKDIYSKYYVQSIPRKILIDKNGVIVGNWVGTGEKTEEEVANKIQELLNQ